MSSIAAHSCKATERRISQWKACLEMQLSSRIPRVFKEPTESRKTDPKMGKLILKYYNKLFSPLMTVKPPDISQLPQFPEALLEEKEVTERKTKMRRPARPNKCVCTHTRTYIHAYIHNTDEVPARSKIILRVFRGPFSRLTKYTKYLRNKSKALLTLRKVTEKILVTTKQRPIFPLLQNFCENNLHTISTND